ncbi:hypothetical protein [Silvimonas sp.]|uniref:hypothetical protein n=1 Tax=Silvimonas sp. TaxID=2650811 RepID=UPI002849BAC3|nr:hypothetical protein [Silvimonas sp.]MDR3428221.1 hypothetical protein [Silvimonas sp.]
MTTKNPFAPRDGETTEQAQARVILSPECVNAFAMTLGKFAGGVPAEALISELQQQNAALLRGDMTRAESMLLVQAHTLDGLFTGLVRDAMNAGDLGALEVRMRLALKAQSQARATLQTLAEIKAPRHVAFVQQANIGNQVQVNNGAVAAPARTRKKKNPQNELLETNHGQRLDTRTQGQAGRDDQAMAPVGKKHGAAQR